MIWAVLLFIPWGLHFHLPLLLSNALMAMPFYIAGIAGRRFLTTRQKSWKYLFPVLICLVITSFLSRWNGKVSMVGIYFGNLPFGVSIPIFYLNGFIGSILILSISLLPFPESPGIKSLAMALITIVGIQGVFITIYTDLFGRNNSMVFSLFSTCVIILLCWLSHFGLRRLYQARFVKQLPFLIQK